MVNERQGGIEEYKNFNKTEFCHEFVKFQTFAILLTGILSDEIVGVAIKAPINKLMTHLLFPIKVPSLQLFYTFANFQRQLTCIVSCKQLHIFSYR